MLRSRRAKLLPQDLAGGRDSLWPGRAAAPGNPGDEAVLSAVLIRLNDRSALGKALTVSSTVSWYVLRFNDLPIIFLMVQKGST
jgi:hypothetical protein